MSVTDPYSFDPRIRIGLVLLLLVVVAVLTAGIATGEASTDVVDSFEAQFDPASPEEPRDLTLAWELNESEAGQSVDRIRITVSNESDSPINLYKPGETDVPNPFTVATEGEANDASDGPDLVVDDLTATTISLKIPVGQCGRIDEIQVEPLDEDGMALTNIRRNSSCLPSHGNDSDDSEDSQDGNDSDDGDGEDNVKDGDDSSGGDESDRGDDSGNEEDGDDSSEGDGSNDRDDGKENDGGDDVDDTTEGNDASDVDRSDLFEVTIESADENVTAGGTFHVDAAIHNNGAANGTQDVLFLVDNQTVDSRENVTLGVNETESVTFDIETSGDDVPVLDAAIQTDNDTENLTVSVLEPAYFDVTIKDAPDEVTAGETMTVTASVENTGDRPGTQNLRLVDFEGTVVDRSESISLASEASVTLSLSWSTTTTDAGEDIVNVRSANDSDSTVVAITQFDESTAGPISGGPSTSIGQEDTEDSDDMDADEPDDEDPDTDDSGEGDASDSDTETGDDDREGSDDVDETRPKTSNDDDSTSSGESSVVVAPGLGWLLLVPLLSFRNRSRSD
ncbi:MAG: CARDB domain-containing protein [Natronomonas sp.]